MGGEDEQEIGESGDASLSRERRHQSARNARFASILPARLAGIRVDGIKITIFVLQGLMAALAGVVLASRMTSGQPMSSQGFELEVISACVLGGVSLTGGIGSMSFVIAGVLIMGTVQNVMNLLNVAPFYQYVARGLILLAAVLFDRWKRRKQGV